jgi:hypothetical protein
MRNRFAEENILSLLQGKGEEDNKTYKDSPHNCEIEPCLFIGNGKKGPVKGKKAREEDKEPEVRVYLFHFLKYHRQLDIFNSVASQWL